MRHELWGVLVAAVGILGADVSSRAVEASHMRQLEHTSINVRTYTRPASAGHIPAARRTASAILEQAGIQVSWYECALPDDAARPGACMQPPQSNELLVRIMSAGAVEHPLNVDTLGFAIVDVKAGTGSLATVYADRVSVVAQDAGVNEAELLGRAMAHEMGHLLLGTNRHAPHGLMRGSWSSEDLRRNLASHWLFVGKEGEAMRSGIASRFQS